MTEYDEIALIHETARDADAARFTETKPGAAVHVVAGASHSVQSDAPQALARIIEQSVFGSPGS